MGYNQKWYRKNRSRLIQKAKESQRRYRERNRKYVNDLKSSTPCADCGTLYPACVMDFDHLGDKEAEIADLAKQGGSLTRLREEIAKCEIVCSNCHRLRTHRGSEANSVEAVA